MLKRLLFALTLLTTSSLFCAEELTFSMIKPLAVQEQHIGGIAQMIEKSGLRIVAMKMQKLSEEQAKAFYAEHKERPFFGELIKMITSGPVVAMVIEGDEAVARLRTVVGATDPKKAASGTIRASFGKDITNNAIHASDGSEGAKREIPFFFTPNEIYAKP